MFSGIVEKVAVVRHPTQVDGALRLELDTGFGDLALGESVSVNGVCLTVVEKDEAGRASFFVSGETLARANLADLREGAPVNLERAVTLATRLSGHLVQGHVDGLGRVTEITRVDESHRVVVSLASELRAFCVRKGSIALDGVSLTLNEVSPLQADGHFSISVNLIPHTWDQTHFRLCAVGDAINVEVDVIAKYVEQLCHAYIER